MNKRIVFCTNLKVWSISKGIGAPSFYKTLELYNNAGFDVVLYTTEKNLEIKELKNVRVVNVPKLNAIKVPYLYSVNRLINYLLNQLLFLSFYLIKGAKNVDIFYGYEIEYIPALKLISKLRGKPFVSRFQGTILSPLMEKKLWKIRYFPHYFSIKIPADITIMTDDGTKGDLVAQVIGNKSKQFKFLKNGVDFKLSDEKCIGQNIKAVLRDVDKYEYNFISVSRLQKWKRLDRSIAVFEKFQKNFPDSRFIIVGDGDKKRDWEKLVEGKLLAEHVVFTGGVNKDEIYSLMQASDIFLSHYELSNVGNPLWEAMFNKCLIVTIDNGDTGKIIKDSWNGIISSEESYLDNATKLSNQVNIGIEHLKVEASITLENNVSSWESRMAKELELVINEINIS